MEKSISKREIEEVSNLLYNLIHPKVEEVDYPPDEYDSEARELIEWARTSLEYSDGENAIAEKLGDIFSRNFEHDYSIDNFVPIQSGIKSILAKYEAIRMSMD